MTKEELEKENAELEEENGKLLQKITQLEKDVTENESDCSMCDFPKLKQDLEKEKCELLGIIQGKDTAIQELKKKNTKLQQACHKWFMRWREAKKDALYYDSSLQKQIQATLKLQKENTELKETLKTYNGCGDWDNDFHACRVYLQHEELEMYIHQLREAKEIIDSFLDFESSCQERGIYISDEMREKANKFLKEK